MDTVKNGFNAVKRYPLPTFKKLSINNLHGLTIRCLLNVNGLLHKQSVKALTVH